MLDSSGRGAHDLKKIVICLAFLVFIVAFVLSIRWARQIQGDSLWAGISPKFVGEAIQEKEHGTAWRAVPFCASFDQKANLTESPRCKSIEEAFPDSGFCGIQNEPSHDLQLGQIAPAQFVQSLQTYLSKKHCETLVLDVDSLFSLQWSRDVIPALRKADPDLQLVLAVRPASEQKIEWQTLCGLYDELIVLAYDKHVPGKTEIGEMAPLDWVKSALQDALEGCPKEKLRLGIAAYGYDWKTGTLLPENQAGFPQVNDDFVETTKKRAQKFNLAHEMGIHKFFLWALGMEH
jgi:hypothetical protein